MGTDLKKPSAHGQPATVGDEGLSLHAELRALAEESGFYPDELAHMLARDRALIARMNAAPDMGGAMLVELSEFLARRAERGKG